MGTHRLWVIGDIHGMFDPLNRLLRRIRLVEQQRKGQDCTLIFLGDYIDYGPSSREVLDSLIRLRREFNTVFLAGNHEDLLLQFLKNDDIYQRYGNVWFRGNDGHVTVASLMDDPEILQKVFAPNAGARVRPEDVKLSEAHRDFLENLQYAHTEELRQGERVVRFAFCHGLLHSPGQKTSPAPKKPDAAVEKQLALRSYEQFHTFRKEHDFWIEDTHVWNRSLGSGRYGDYVLVHGHTPTVLLQKYYGDIKSYQPASGLPYLHFSAEQADVYRGPEHRLEVDATLDDLTAIDIDTGAVYGKCLTALMLDVDDLLQANFFSAYQVRMDRPHRHDQDVAISTFHFREDAT